MIMMNINMLRNIYISSIRFQYTRQHKMCIARNALKNCNYLFTLGNSLPVWWALSRGLQINNNQYIRQLTKQDILQHVFRTKHNAPYADIKYYLFTYLTKPESLKDQATNACYNNWVKFNVQYKIFAFNEIN